MWGGGCVGMCMHVYACVCMCMHVYACVCMCMHVYVCVCMCVHVCACVCMAVRASVGIWASPPVERVEAAAPSVTSGTSQATTTAASPRTLCLCKRPCCTSACWAGPDKAVQPSEGHARPRPVRLCLGLSMSTPLQSCCLSRSGRSPIARVQRRPSQAKPLDNGLGVKKATPSAGPRDKTRAAERTLWRASAGYPAGEGCGLGCDGLKPQTAQNPCGAMGRLLRAAAIGQDLLDLPQLAAHVAKLPKKRNHLHKPTSLC